MSDQDFESEYLARKKKLRTLHKNLKDSREIQEIYQKASAIKNIHLKDLQAAIHHNFKKIFTL